MRKLVIGAAIVLAALYLWNASWLAPMPDGDGLRLIAHRGVHQTFALDGVESDTCTAGRIDPPRHEFIENTIPAMKAAFAAGADIVELDVHPTTDGEFAVFHDWTIDCRTEAFGVTRHQSMYYLKQLDIGYGYTADQGLTFPLRTRGEGLMPSLSEVVEEIPQGRFLVNFKSNEGWEADRLAAFVGQDAGARRTIWGAYGGEAPTRRAANLLEDFPTFHEGDTRTCLTRYMLLGWLDFTPEACRRTKIMLPINLAKWMWGWPNRFMVRMRDAGSEIIYVGPYERGDQGASGIDDPDMLTLLPAGTSGYIWTNRIEIIGPALGRGLSLEAQREQEEVSRR